MVPVSLVVRSRAMQGTRAGVASWRWSSALSGASALWPMHQAGQAVVGGVLFSSVWSAGAAIGLPFLGLWCVVGLSGGRVKRKVRPDGRGRAEGERTYLLSNNRVFLRCPNNPFSALQEFIKGNNLWRPQISSI